MTDPYEYLLSKLNVMLEFMPNGKLGSLSIKSETGKKIILNNYVPITWTKKKIFRYYRTLNSNEFFRQYHTELDFFCNQLQQFPDDLESIEHVDLLLTLNGLNKGA